MRGIDGPCGHYLEAEDDDSLVAKVQDHAAGEHPELDLTEDQIKSMVAEGARDV